MTADNENRTISATWLTGITFSALAIPLALFGMQPLSIPLGESTIQGRFDDYAVEYLGAAAVVSLGLGISRLGKGAASPKGTVSQQPITQQQPNPTAQGAQAVPDLYEINPPVITAASLKSSGLDVFLAEDDSPVVMNISPPYELDSPRASSDSAPKLSPSNESSQNKPENEDAGTPHQSIEYHSVQAPSPQSAAPPQTAIASSANQAHAAESLEAIVAEVQSIMEQMSLQSFGLAAVQSGTSGPHTPQAEETQPSSVQVATIPLSQHHTPIFPAAQSYVSFARPQAAPNQPVTSDRTAELDLLKQVHTIRETVQRLMNQVDSVQTELEQAIDPDQRLVHLHAAKAPSYTVSSMEPIRTVNLQGNNIRPDARATA